MGVGGCGVLDFEEGGGNQRILGAELREEHADGSFRTPLQQVIWFGGSSPYIRFPNPHHMAVRDV